MAIKAFANKELQALGIFGSYAYVDSIVVREKKAYPAYFGTYDRFNTIKKFVNSIGNLYLIGRNGMHRYNNQDHSMLTAMKAVELIKNQSIHKDQLWAINADDKYHEQK